MIPESLSSAIHRHRPLFLTAVMLMMVFAAVFAWRSAREASAQVGRAEDAPPIEVETLTVRYEVLPQSLEAVGSLQAIHEVTLAPEVAGRVVSIAFDAGSPVKRGAPLVELYDAPERADRGAALADAHYARLQHERSQRLAPTGAESVQMLQQRDAELERAEAAVRQLDARIAQKTISAPFDGRIGIRRVNLGQYLNPGDPIATLVALNPLYVNFNLPQQDLVKLAVGGQVTVRCDAYPDKTFHARINAIDPVIGSDTRNIVIQATLANPQELLRPGLYVTASVELPPRQKTIVLPLTAINTSASGDSVYVLRAGKAELAPVVAGLRAGTRVVIESGLAPGDVIVTRGQVRIRPGARTVAANSNIAE